MCGRASLTKTEEELEKRFSASFYAEDIERYNPLPNYNIAPSNITAILTSDNLNHFQFAQWGLWSQYNKKPFSLINARLETLQKKKVFSPLLESHRCIIPLDGYYEWKIINSKTRIPHRVTRNDNTLFSVAGLWNIRESDDNNPNISFTIITLEAPDFMREIHHRVPSILSQEQEELWLNPDTSIKDSLSLIKAQQEDSLHIYTVSQKVNNTRNNNNLLIEEVEYADPGIQLDLF